MSIRAVLALLSSTTRIGVDPLDSFPRSPFSLPSRTASSVRGAYLACTGQAGHSATQLCVATRPRWARSRCSPQPTSTCVRALLAEVPSSLCSLQSEQLQLAHRQLFRACALLRISSAPHPSLSLCRSLCACAFSPFGPPARRCKPLAQAASTSASTSDRRRELLRGAPPATPTPLGLLSLPLGTARADHEARNEHTRLRGTGDSTQRGQGTATRGDICRHGTRS